MNESKSSGGRPPLNDKPLTGVLLFRCSEEMQARVEGIAEELGIKASELLRAYVDDHTLAKVHPHTRSLIKASHKVVEEEQ